MRDHSNLHGGGEAGGTQHCLDPVVSTEPRKLPGPSSGTGKPPPVHPGPTEQGQRCWRGSLQECSALLNRPFPRAIRDPSSCRSSRAGDDRGEMGLTISLLLGFSWQRLPKRCPSARLELSTSQRACVCSGKVTMVL